MSRKRDLRVKSNNYISDDKTEVLVSSETIYKGKAFSFCSDIVKLPNGKMARKDYVKYPQAVAILAFLNDKRIILEKQFRYPVGKLLYEIPAGKIDDPLEPKEKAAERELLEETGFKANRMEYLFSYFPAVGYSSEVIHVFKAAEITKESQDLDEDEFIDVISMELDEVVEKIKNHEIEDAKTIISILYFCTFCRKNLKME
jgi:ADP-ribose pyrophosphatase